MLKSISRPVKLRTTDRPLLPCFLGQASLLQRISRPLKQNPANKLHLQSFLGLAPLLQSISRPVKLSLSDRPLLSLAPALLQLKGQPASTDLSPTDHLLPTDPCLQMIRTPAPLHYTEPEGIVLLVPSLRSVVTCPTDPHWICIQRKGSSQMIRT